MSRSEKKAKHPFLISWQPNLNKADSEPIVKRQFKTASEAEISSRESVKSARLSAKDDSPEATNKDIIKSLILASLILALELVIYLAWKK